MEEIRFVPQMTTPVADADKPDFEKLITLLEDLDDVQKVYHSGEY